MAALREALSASLARIGAPAFWRVYRIDRRMRRKLTPAGWFVAALTLASAVFGFNTTESLIYQLFGLGLGLLLVAAIASSLPGLRATAARTLPQAATAGVEFEYSLTLRNTGAKSVDALHVEEILAVDRPTTGEFVAFKVREDRSRNFFDRLVGYLRWVSLMRMKVGARPPAAVLAALTPGEARRIPMRCLPLRRGELIFDAVSIGRPEPLGLMRALRRIRLRESLIVMPKTYPVSAPRLPGARRLQPGGVEFAGRVGDAEEFMSLRDYRSGDTPRRIHWKAWARTGRLVVKEYQDEFFVRHALLLDTFPSGDAAAFEAAVSLAASLVMMPRSGESLLDLMFVERRAYTLTQGRGLAAPIELLRVLATVQPSRGSFRDLAEAALLHAARISGAICVLLAWDEPRRQLVASLRARGIPLRVWVVRDEGAHGALEAGPMASDARNFRVVDAASLAQELARP